MENKQDKMYKFENDKILHHVDEDALMRIIELQAEFAVKIMMRKNAPIVPMEEWTKETSWIIFASWLDEAKLLLNKYREGELPDIEYAESPKLRMATPDLLGSGMQVVLITNEGETVTWKIKDFTSSEDDSILIMEDDSRLKESSIVSAEIEYKDEDAWYIESLENQMKLKMILGQETYGENTGEGEAFLKICRRLDWYHKKYVYLDRYKESIFELTQHQVFIDYTERSYSSSDNLDNEVFKEIISVINSEELQKLERSLGQEELKVGMYIQYNNQWNNIEGSIEEVLNDGVKLGGIKLNFADMYAKGNEVKHIFKWADERYYKNERKLKEFARKVKLYKKDIVAAYDEQVLVQLEALVLEDHGKIWEYKVQIDKMIQDFARSTHIKKGKVHIGDNLNEALTRIGDKIYSENFRFFSWYDDEIPNPNATLSFKKSMKCFLAENNENLYKVTVDEVWNDHIIVRWEWPDGEVKEKKIKLDQIWLWNAYTVERVGYKYTG